MSEALKARNRQGRPKFTEVALPSRLFRAVSAKSLHLILPGPMGQDLTFRAVGAGKKSKANTRFDNSIRRVMVRFLSLDPDFVH